MNSKKDPFYLLFISMGCPGCYSEIVVGLSETMKKYGFVCPYCKEITSADSMWESYIHSSRYEEELDEN